MENDLLIRILVVFGSGGLVIAVARWRPRRPPAPLHVGDDLRGPGVFLFTADSCDSCDAARAVYTNVLGRGGFIEYTWEAEPALLTRLGVEEIPVATVLNVAGDEIASFRLVPKPRALARAVRKMNRAAR